MSTLEDVDSKLSKPHTKAGRLQRACLNVLLQHQRDGALPTSGRFIFYELEGQGVIPKVYLKPDGTRKQRTPAQDVADALLYLREKEIVPWAWLVDETRDLTVWDYAKSVAEYVSKKVEAARIDLWDGGAPPLILCESRSLTGVLRNIARDYLCPIAATNGQCGGFLHTDIAPLIKAASKDGDVQRVFYLGDLDFSGRQIEENTKKVLSEHARLDWQRIAITQEQANERNLTPTSKGDGRFRQATYHNAIETEALSQTEIQRILRKRLDTELPKPLKDVLKEEAKQRVRVRENLRTNGRDERG